ncbi:MAG: hypothetical protein IE927_10925 [Rhodobacterales bacterium]|nr:hypothetical protein [Rhodobacterales bacterium]
MILGWLKLLALVLAALTLVFWLVQAYSRSIRRERLEKRFDQGDVPGDRDAYIEAGMAEYDHGLRRRLIWLVYIIPLGAMAIALWVVNYG